MGSFFAPTVNFGLNVGDFVYQDIELRRFGADDAGGAHDTLPHCRHRARERAERPNMPRRLGRGLEVVGPYGPNVHIWTS